MRIEEILETKPAPHLTPADPISEAFLGLDKVVPLLQKAFSKKADKAGRYESQLKTKISKAKRDAATDGVDVNAVERAVKRKVRGVKKMDSTVISTQIREILEEMKSQSAFKTITFSLVVFVTILVLNTTMALVLSPIIGSAGASMVVGVFFAPVVEEIGRYISIKNQFTGAYLITFNIGEYLVYMLQASTLGVSLGAMAVLRLLPVAMHTMWTLIMRQRMKDGAGSKSIASTAPLHMMYNAFPVFGGIVTAVTLGDLNKETRPKKAIAASEVPA